jgi:hypothetical protein
VREAGGAQVAALLDGQAAVVADEKTKREYTRRTLNPAIEASLDCRAKPGALRLEPIGRPYDDDRVGSQRWNWWSRGHGQSHQDLVPAPRAWRGRKECRGRARHPIGTDPAQRGKRPARYRERIIHDGRRNRLG